MKTRTSRNPCELCGGHKWYCYDGETPDGELVPMLDGWEPTVDYYHLWWEDSIRCFWVDECATCGAVVS